MSGESSFIMPGIMVACLLAGILALALYRDRRDRCPHCRARYYNEFCPYCIRWRARKAPRRNSGMPE